MSAIVSDRAVYQRASRKLWRDDRLILRTRRTGPYSDQLPRFYLVNDSNHVVGPGWDSLRELAADLGLPLPA